MLNLTSATLREERESRKKKCFSKGLYLQRRLTCSIAKVLTTFPEQTFKCIDLLNQMITLVQM